MRKFLLLSALAAMLSFAVSSCTEEQSSDALLPESSSLSAVLDESDILAVQRQALTSLYEATGGAAWTHNDNWNTDAPLSEWYGVSVEGDYVTAIELPGNNLTGQLPDDLAKLEGIQSIILSDNLIGGKIPAALGNESEAATRSEASGDDDAEFEAALAQLAAIADDGEVEVVEAEEADEVTPALGSLRVLDLSNNRITGTLPDELGNLGNLRTLSISGNLMNGEISAEMQNSPMWLGLSESPSLEQKEDNVLKLAANATVAVKSVTLDQTKATIYVGKSVTLKATVSPTNATTKTVTWKSSNKAVAKVTTKGKVTGLKAGTATITVTTKSGSKTAKCKVTVKDVVAVTGVTLPDAKATIYVGDTKTLKPTVAPSDATDKTVTWKSSNKAVAKVSTAGVVTALKAGTATITVTTTDGSKTATCKVTVKEKVAVTGVTLPDAKVTIYVGDTKTLKPTVAPSGATDKTVTWKSSNKAVAKVSTAGVVTALKAGTATITVTTTDGSKTATCKVTVKEKVAVTSVTLNKTTASITIGSTLTLKPTVAPSDATDTSVTWKSSNKAVAKVSSKGVVTALKAGTATITVTTTDGSKTAKCKVTVTDPSITGGIEGFNRDDEGNWD